MHRSADIRQNVQVTLFDTMKWGPKKKKRQICSVKESGKLSVCIVHNIHNKTLCDDDDAEIIH